MRPLSRLLKKAHLFGEPPRRLWFSDVSIPPLLPRQREEPVPVDGAQGDHVKA